MTLEYSTTDSIVTYESSSQYLTDVNITGTGIELSRNRSSLGRRPQRLKSPSDDDLFYFILDSVVVPAVFSFITFVGVTGNVLVIYVIVTRERMRTTTNLLLLNLAVSDLAFVSFVPPVTAYMFATSSWPFGDVVCRLMHFVVNVTAYVTIYTLVLVSVVRYMTIVHSASTAWWVVLVILFPRVIRLQLFNVINNLHNSCKQS